MYAATNTAPKADGRAVPWNKGKLIGQKPPLKRSANRRRPENCQDRKHPKRRLCCRSCSAVGRSLPDPVDAKFASRN